MSDIRFDEEQQRVPLSQSEEKPLLIRFVLATGIVSTDDAARYVLLSIVLICTLTAFFVLFSDRSQNKPTLHPSASAAASSYR